ncbi:SUF system NifU family Fe-S cluster assembly protein [Brooklawnia cerclae]|uniref:Nitrogen fixation NifU-like protein n=1 Tax=Brooklawnia cerclae TaxID=349934 RepID=A0ABX0SK83_9ACTN|nr:SUF system NifU family Fe-S cluster assembly protein [Brooklawnia cerclae]NIH57465.1 nitrogen fixation NifU-like protein [Brooklawnia cerclae]
MNVEEMYQDIILDHYREKHHAGLREPFGAEVHHVNPTCGDEITLRVELDGDRVGDISYHAEGCSISQASTSVMTDLVIGRDIVDTLALFDDFRTLMEGQGRIEPDEDRLEDGIAFAGVAQFPGRVKCAMLGWSALRDALARAGASLPGPVANETRSA